MLNRPSHGGLSKTVSSGEAPVSGRAISPPGAVHAASATYRAEGDVNIPYGLQQFCYGQACIACLEPLVTLEGKDQFQVFCFSPIVQEPIIPDLLETGREHMHKVAADKFRVIKGDGAPGVTWMKAAGRESHLAIIQGKDAAVRDGNLMGIPAKIFDGIAKSVKSFLYVGTPILIIEGMAEFIPGIRIPEGSTGRGKREFPVVIEFIQAGKEFSFEFIP